MFLKDKYEGHYERDDTLPETSSEYRHKIPKWHEYHMSSFMKYQVWSMQKWVHHLLIHIERKELEGVYEKGYKKTSFHKSKGSIFCIW